MLHVHGGQVTRVEISEPEYPPGLGLMDMGIYYYELMLICSVILVVIIQGVIV